MAGPSGRRHLSRRGLLLGSLSVGLAPAARAASEAAPVRLRRGINLWPWFSLTREFPPPRLDYDWPPFQPQRPVPTRRNLARLAALGFDFVRLPLDPGPFLAFDGARRAALMADVAAAVAMIRGAGLSAVVNVQANGATHHYTPDKLYGGLAAPLLPAYQALVADLARRFAEARDVVLEPVNEPPQACGADDWAVLQAGLHAAARRVAPRLTLVATGACGGLIPGLAALDPAPLRAAGPTLFSFHFYEPYLFTHQGAPWMSEPVYRDLNAVPWPASAGTLAATLAAVRARRAADPVVPAADRDAIDRLTVAKLTEYFAARPDRAYIDYLLGGAAGWAARHGIPPRDMLLGEFGALRTDGHYVAAGAEDRVRYIGDVRRGAEGFGFPWAMWNLTDGFGLLGPDGQVDPAVAGALGLGGAPDGAGRSGLR